MSGKKFVIFAVVNVFTGAPIAFYRTKRNAEIKARDYSPITMAVMEYEVLP